MTNVNTLRDQLDGRVLLPGDDDFDPARTGFQLLDPHRPDAVVAAAGAGDVATAVRFAAEYGQPLAVQATGHGRNAALPGGILLATGAMNTVQVDPNARTATVPAGATWRQVIEATAPYGLAPLSGSFPNLGAVSYTLGGGIGLLSRRYGFAADHVESLDLVTPDGRERRVDADHDPDLYWGLRGGGGNLGVVTRMRIRLLPVTSVHGGSLTFDADRDPQVPAGWWRWTRDLPDEMTSAISMLRYPDLPMFPPDLRGRRVIKVQLCWCGPAEQGRRLVEPLRRLGDCIADSVRELPYTESGSIFAEPEQAHPYRSTVVLLPDLDEAGLSAVHAAAGAAELMCIVNIRHLGGALARPPRQPNAVGHRDAGYLVSVLSPVAEEDRAAVTGTHRAVLGAWHSASLGQQLSFRFGPLAPDEIRTGYDPDTYRRLTALRATVDPDGLLRPNHPVPAG